MLLTYSNMGIYCEEGEAEDISDAFNAVAQLQRRNILNYLAMQESSVADIVDAMQLGQPSVSKAPEGLKNVGLVESRSKGRQMLYKVNAAAIRPLHEWTSTFERLWTHQLLPVKVRAEARNEA
jgi:DNA-binding transcriptional ArsR family regulator